MQWVIAAGKAEIALLLIAGFSGALLFRQLPVSLRYLAVLVWVGLVVEATAYVFRAQHLPNFF